MKDIDRNYIRNFVLIFTSQAALLGKGMKQAHADWDFRIKWRTKKITFLMKKFL
jgi:hypothetical protein